jgi:hypothetical protein
MTATVLSSSPMTGNVPGDSSQNDGDSGRFCQDSGVSAAGDEDPGGAGIEELAT